MQEPEAQAKDILNLMHLSLETNTFNLAQIVSLIMSSFAVKLK